MIRHVIVFSRLMSLWFDIKEGV